MTHPLHSARLKLERAEELLQEVDDDYTTISEEAEKTPVQFWVDSVFSLAERATWFVVRCPKETVPGPRERWGLLVGDAMHNTRSALDHLACRLVERNNGTVTNATSFPIWDEAPQDQDAERRFERRIRGMKEEHKDAVRQLQPFNNLGTDAADKLIALASLDNLDKHQIIVPVTATVAGTDKTLPRIVTEFPTTFDFRWNAGKEAAAGVELFRFRPHSHMGNILHLDVAMLFRATFGDPLTSLFELREIRTYVVGVIESFAPGWS